jgi:hypothetical protein
MIGLTVIPARADELELLVMPGPVISGHADIEAECGDCHVAFSRSRQRTLCLECHEAVASDVAGKRGFHGRDAAAQADSCASCHTEHQGRDADIIRLDTAAFNH